MITTPIIDFVEKYNDKKPIRLHMPGHKGKNLLGFENKDITEIDGADFLYQAEGIIKESEMNASKIFGCDTFYSTEGSSLCIRAMLFLALSVYKIAERPIILAARNVHKTFITAAALLDFDVEWLYSDSSHYHTCVITASMVEEKLKNMKIKPFAVYLTSPDYLGYISDIKEISKVCKKYGVYLLVDNAHGAYFKFLNPSIHPIDLGCDMCCASAHKTLPSLTGGAYLHISSNTNTYFTLHAKEALSLFASTSPSYLILQSLDMVNYYLSCDKDRFSNFCSYIDKIKECLINNGYKIIGQEKMKICIDAKDYGYSGDEIASYLSINNIECEFHDDDFIVLMPTPQNTKEELEKLKKVLLNLKRKSPKTNNIFKREEKKQVMTIRNATFAMRETINVSDSLNRILADTAVTCPPAVPIVICGERITLEDIQMFKYYGVFKCSVVIENK